MINDLQRVSISDNFSEGTFKLIPLEDDEEVNYQDLEFITEIREGSDTSSSSDKVVDRQITYHELAMMEPIIQKKITLTQTNAPYNISKLLQKGNPTSYIIDKYIAPNSRLKNVRTGVKLSMVQKIKYMLSSSKTVSNQEIQMATIIGTKIVNEICEKDEITFDDIEFKKHALEDGGFLENNEDPTSNSQTVFCKVPQEEVEMIYKKYRFDVSDFYKQSELTAIHNVFCRMFGNKGDKLNKYRKQFGIFLLFC
jgi:hypothetical protein